jgi:virginiamycin B lyase
VAKDADGNTIIGTDPYVNPITLADSDGSGATSLSSTSITSPATGSVTFSYSGAGALAGTTVTITPSASGAGGNTAATLHVYAHHAFIEYALTGTYPNSLATGSDGNVWFGYQNTNAVGYITPGGSISQFATDGGASQMVKAGDGNIWFTEFSVNEIGRVTPGGTVTNFSGITGIEPFGITVGSNGSLFFVTFGNGTSGGGYAGQITTGGSLSASSQLAGPPQLQSVASGSDGRLWMTEPFSQGTEYLDAMTTGFAFTRYTIPGGAQLREIIAGPNNDLWLNDSGNQTMDEVTTSGSFIHQYPESSTFGQGLAEGIDGNLYYGGDGSNVLGVMTTGGSETDYAVPTAGANVSAITSGPDGNIWFTEFSTNKIGRFIL